MYVNKINFSQLVYCNRRKKKTGKLFSSELTVAVGLLISFTIIEKCSKNHLRIIKSDYVKIGDLSLTMFSSILFR